MGQGTNAAMNRALLLEPAGSDYARLSRRIRQAGLLERRHGYYALRIGAVAAVMAAAWTVFALLGESWWQLLVAVVLAGAFTQVGFLGHDAGHRQIFRSRRANDGLSYCETTVLRSYWQALRYLHAVGAEAAA